MLRHPLVGEWLLVSCEHHLAGGAVSRPLGVRPLGRLVYTKAGTMIVMLMRRDRKPFRSSGLFEGATAERAAAAESYVAYSGRWEPQVGSVVHHVDMSYFPNWIGTRQLRFFKISGSRVTFTTRPYESRGIRQVARLVWRRAR